MKANTEKETIRTMQEIIDEVKNTYLDGNVFIAVNYKGDLFSTVYLRTRLSSTFSSM